MSLMKEEAPVFSVHLLRLCYTLYHLAKVQALRVILNSLQAKSKERQWLRHQTSGELDDTKLIEGKDILRITLKSYCKSAFDI
jgi:hypothetical protein